MFDLLMAAGGDPVWLPQKRSDNVVALRADKGVTITGQGISDWVNQGGDTARVDKLTQPTDARRANRYNCRGRSQIYHNGGISQLHIEKSAFGGAGALGTPLTIMALLRPMGTGTQVPVASATRGLIQTLGASWPKDFRGNNGSNLTASGVLLEHEVVLLTVTIDGSGNGKLYKNDTLVASGSIGNNAIDGLFVGSSGTPSSFFHGQTGEVDFFSTALSATEIADLYNNYFKPYWRAGSVGTPILWIGDSIFYGVGDSGTGSSGVPNKGARSRLYAEWNTTPSGGKWPAEVGDIQDGGYPGDMHHCISGHSIAQTYPEIQGVIGPGNAKHPAVIVMLLGANEARNLSATYVADGQPSSTLNLFETFVRDMWLREHCQFVLCNLLDQDPARFPTGQANVNDFNAGLPARIAKMRAGGIGIQFADLRAALGAYNTTYYDATDGLHPTPAGHALIADTLRAPIAAALAAVTTYRDQGGARVRIPPWRTPQGISRAA